MKFLPVDKLPVWLAPGLQPFPPHSVKFLGKFQFLRVHCFNGLTTKGRDTRVSLDYIPDHQDEGTSFQKNTYVILPFKTG